MADEPSAVAMVNYYANSGAPFVRGRNVYVQYSNHKELKTENSHATGVSSLLFYIYLLTLHRIYTIHIPASALVEDLCILAFHLTRR